MVIDSDEETDSPQLPEDDEQQPGYDFEADDAEIDPSCPYEDILRQVDVPLGSTVLDLAVPRILPESARPSLDPFPPVLREMMVISAVCGDFSTRIVALPLQPPHPDQTQPSAWKIQTVSISGVFSHQELPTGIALTFTCREESDSGAGSDAAGQECWDLLVATHSAEASGLLLVYRIPILESTGKAPAYVLSQDHVEPVQRCYLPSPAKSITFNPSSYPSPRHSTLLVSFYTGCVKIYSCFTFSAKTVRASRKAAGPRSRNAEDVELGGKWLITLYPGFEQSSSGTVCRKTVVHAEWVLGGQAVIVLLADGTWGVWDVEGAGPGSIKGPLERQSSVEGVRGGSLTTFSVSGRILNPLPGSKGGPAGDAGVEPRAKFAPTTPSTKRVREDTLLSRGSPGTSSNPSLRGEISVFQTNSLRETFPDESILFRHGDQSAVIPSLLSLWRNANKPTGIFDASNRCRVSVLQDVNLLGEHLRGIGHLPTSSRHGGETNRQTFNILVTGEHRIVILAPKLSESENTRRISATPTDTMAVDTDQLQLQRGELGVDGMGRVLSGMASVNRLQSPVKRNHLFS